jgi:AraC-like DNA-binding protein
MKNETMGDRDFYIEKRISKAPLQYMHHHRSYEMYYMVKGNREYFIEDRFFTVEEGDIVIIPKEVFHRTEGDGGLRFLVHFSESFLEKYFTDASMQPVLSSLPFVFRGDEGCNVQLLHCLTRLEAVYDKDSPDRAAIFAGYLYQLLFTVANEENIYTQSEYADARITGVVRYINENYNTLDGIDEIAQEFYISKYHLCRLFKKKLGIPLVSYLNTVKIQHACSMIRDADAKLTEVAMQCGFNSSSYFCKVFKKEIGLSPVEYRLRHKQR